MDAGYRGLVAVVTGTTGGIGAAIAEALAAEGATVVAHRGSRTDLTDERVVDAFFDDVSDRHGRVDVVFANAGKWPEPARPLDRTPVADLRATLDANLLSAMLTARAFMRGLRRTGPRADGRGAAVVFTGSTAGRFGEAGHVAYAAAKAGLRGLTLTLKNELPAIDPAARANLVEPGWTVTPAVAEHVDEALVARITRTMALRRVAAVDDVVATALYLGSPTLARHVTGAFVAVAGGMEGRTIWP